MGKSLKTIQTIMKITKILCKVAFIFCIIGAVGSIIGLICIQAVGNITIDGVSVMDYIVENAEMTEAEFYASMIEGAIICALQAILSKLTETYCKHELATGTPFTEEGAKELFRLGVLTISINVGTAIILAIVHMIVVMSVGEAEGIEMTITIGEGLFMMFLSVVFRHGAEWKAQAEQKVEIPSEPFDL